MLQIGDRHDGPAPIDPLAAPGRGALAYGLVLAATLFGHAQRAPEVAITNVSYDPTRELYKAINEAFAKDWKAQTGQTVTIRTSHGGSGRQARTVIDGLEADVVTLALAGDIDAIAREAKLLPADWQTRLPNNSSPYTSTIVFLVRKGNPKGIKDWDDLAKPGVAGDHPQPEDLGRRALELPRRLGLRARPHQGRRRQGARPSSTRSIATSRCSTPARAARPPPSSQRGIGDVLIAWENEALPRARRIRRRQVRHRLAVALDPGRAAGGAGRRSRRQARHPQGGRGLSRLPLHARGAGASSPRNFYRPSKPEAADPADLARLPELKLVTIDEVFGGWGKAQAEHFADGGMFDQIYKPGGSAATMSLATAHAATFRFRQPSALPGFGLTFGFAVTYLSLIVLIPLGVLVVRASGLGLDGLWQTATSRRACWRRSSFSFGVSLAAAALNAVFGLVVAWVLTRYAFPGRRLLDAIVDLPFALPTAVAGIALAALYAPNGWIGGLLAPLGIKVAYTPLGIFVALVFIGLPFVVRTVQPVLAELDREIEEASATLGASRAQTVLRVILPSLLPAMLTGFALAFARAVGEYGSVIFIAGNMPFVSEIAPLLIVIQLEEFDYAGATAIATIMLAISFVSLLVINLHPGVEPAEVRPCLRPRCPASPGAEPVQLAAVTDEARLTRCVLIAVAVAFLALFLVLPLLAVFAEALRRGIARLFRQLRRPRHAGGDPPDAAGGGDRRAAERGVRHRRGLGDRQVRLRRQEPPRHPHRPAVLGVAGGVGPGLRAAVRRARPVRRLAAGPRHPDHLRRARHRAGDDLRHLPVRRPRADPADAGAGHGRRGGGADARRLRACACSSPSRCPT